MATVNGHGESWIASHLTALTVFLGLVLAVIPGVAHHFEHEVPLCLQAVIPSLEKYGIFTLIERFGDALFIAACLWFLAEQAKEDTKFQAILKDILLNTAAAVLPEDLKERLRGYLDISLVRTDWNIEYYIDLWPGTSNHLRLLTISKYTMYNYSLKPQDYEFIYEVEESQCGHPADITEMTVGTNAYSKAILTSMIAHEGGYLKFKQSIEPPPQKFFEKISPHAEQTFMAQSIECFENFLASPFVTTYPVLKTTFTVYHDQTKVKVNFEIVGQETRDPKAVTDSAGNPGQQWKTNKPLLPGQGFFVRAHVLHSSSGAAPGTAGIAPTPTSTSGHTAAPVSAKGPPPEPPIS
jgi:hypothetical protein